MADEIIKGTTLVHEGDDRARTDAGRFGREQSVNAQLLTEFTDLRSGGLRGFRSDLESPDDAAHAADVGDERDPRDRARRRAAGRGRCGTRNSARFFRSSSCFSRRLNVFGGYVVTERMLAMFKPRAARTGRNEKAVTDTSSAAALAINVAYLVTGICFIIGLRYLSSPKTARRGNRISMLGMAIALVATGFQLDFAGAWWILLVGRRRRRGDRHLLGARREDDRDAANGRALQRRGRRRGGDGRCSRVPQTRAPTRRTSPGDQAITIVLSSVIGAISFTGSIIAFLKLQELMTGPPDHLSRSADRQRTGRAHDRRWPPASSSPTSIRCRRFSWRSARAALLGVLFVLPIGGADMPVIISLLNSFTGLAAALTGFVLGNNVLIISGALVGASGTLLTLLMGKAMNRSITNVLFGAFGKVASGGDGPAAGTSGSGTVRELSADDVATMLAYAQNVIVVPGYGMAVAQAQHSVRELADQLEKKGVDRQVRDPSGRRPHAGPHERPARRSERALHRALRHGRHQPGVPARRRGARHRRQRRDEPRSAQRRFQPDLRHADSRRRQSPQRRRPQALDEARLRRHRQPALRASRRPSCSSATPKARSTNSRPR